MFSILPSITTALSRDISQTLDGALSHTSPTESLNLHSPLPLSPISCGARRHSFEHVVVHHPAPGSPKSKLNNVEKRLEMGDVDEDEDSDFEGGFDFLLAALAEAEKTLYMPPTSKRGGKGVLSAVPVPQSTEESDEFGDDDVESSDQSERAEAPPPYSPYGFIPSNPRRIPLSSSSQSVLETLTPPPSFNTSEKMAGRKGDQNLKVPTLSPPPSFRTSEKEKTSVLIADPTTDHPPTTSQALIRASESSSSSWSVLSAVNTAVYDALWLASLGSHQLGVMTSGIVSTVLRQKHKKPSWPTYLHLSLHWLRNQLHFPHHTISMVRAATAGGHALNMNLAPKGTQQIPVKFKVVRKHLLRYELEAARHTTHAYPIPPEMLDPKELAATPSLKYEYEIDGEWVYPPSEEDTKEPPKTKRRSWFEWWRGSHGNVGSSSSSTSTQTRKKTILYLHGGAYVFGSPTIYRHFTGQIAKDTGCRLFVPNYRLAPEDPFPAGVHDAFAAYLYLIDPGNLALDHGPKEGKRAKLHTPIDPEDIVLMGDSAGGGLCMALMTYLHNYLRNERGEHMVPLPAAAVLFSPWMDLTFSMKSWRENEMYDWLPARARNIHEPVLPAVANPTYMYIFGEDLERTSGNTPDHSNESEQEGATLESPMDYIKDEALRAKMEELMSFRRDKWLHRMGSKRDDPAVMERRKEILEWMLLHPLVSPLNADFKGMPPILIVSRNDRSDCF
ncbi:hypothetical protein HK102_010573 [Quaeritorhiza haematococci]|nr:hypothetical protein HK102_010573 [Quaeritorhiza haematococci]